MFIPQCLEYRHLCLKAQLHDTYHDEAETCLYFTTSPLWTVAAFQLAKISLV